MSQVIKPTVGRKVWYRPSEYDRTGINAMHVALSQTDTTKFQPLDATVVAVWSDTCVNLLVTDANGRQFPVLSCELVQAGRKAPYLDADGKPTGRYCEWPTLEAPAAPAVDPEAAADVQDAA